MEEAEEMNGVSPTVSPENGSQEKSFEEKIFKENVYECLYKMREDGHFCDAAIHCGAQTFKVQRNILSTCSPYFRALFTYQENPGERSKKNNNKLHEITIKEMAPETMDLVIRYAYTREVPSDPSTLLQLHVAADRFQIEGLLKSCAKALVQEITLENCMQIRAFASAFPYSCEEIKVAADAFLLKHFDWIYRFSADFQQLEADDLCAVLGSDRLNVRSEGVPLDAVCRWVAHDFESRNPHVDKLLGHVRLGLVTNDTCFRILNYYKQTAATPFVHAVLHKVFNLLTQPEVRQNVQLSTPRLPSDLVFVFGGSNLGWPLRLVEAFDVRSLTWKECGNKMFRNVSYHGTAVLGQVVYVIGGFNGASYVSSCLAFYPAQNRWTQVAPMHDRRCYVSVAALDGYIYAMGGYDGRTRQKSAERFHPPTNQWSLIAPMMWPRSDGGAAATGGKLYVVGGFNGQESLLSAEMYDPQTNQWTLLQPMRERRSGIGLVAYNGFLYVAGGFNGTRRLNTVERYNTVDGEWYSAQPMLNARSNFAMTVIEDMILVIGGYGGRHTTTRVEQYDTYTDRWSISTELTVSRSALSACVVSDLPNVEAYTSRLTQGHNN